MCNLYSQTKTRETVGKLFQVSDNRQLEIELQSAIFPGHNAPIVRHAEDGEREMVIASWGFVLTQKGKVARRVTNVRDDKIRTSGFWRGSFEERRCLVPVTSFSEPKGKQPAVWHWFALDDDRSLFAFAGIWQHFRGYLRPDSEPVEMDIYAFMTTTPNELVKPVHPTRMPVMLTSDDDFDCWMDGTPDEAYALAMPYPAEEMKVVASGEKFDS